MPRPRLPKEQESGPGADAIRSMRRIGGHPALDFVNTVDPDKPDPEALRDYNALLTWCETVGIIMLDEATKLRAIAKRNAAAAVRGLEDALALREVVSQLVMARVTNRRAGNRTLTTFNQMMRRFSSRIELAATELGYTLKSIGTDEPLSWPVVRLVQLSAELLTSPSFAKVRVCAADGCGWLFLDDSRSHRRRWCSMDSCGNREKARRHYHQARRNPRSTNMRRARF